MDEFNRVLGEIVDSTLGLRSKLIDYQYSEIIRSLMCVYFCGGTCIEDLSKHLIPCVSQHPKLRTCSSDTILRAIEELTEDNIAYTSDNGKTFHLTLPHDKLPKAGELIAAVCKWAEETSSELSTPVIREA